MKRIAGILLSSLIIGSQTLLPTASVLAAASTEGKITRIAIPTDAIRSDDVSVLQRITIRKKQLKLDMTDAEKKRLTQKCPAVQVKADVVRDKNEKVTAERMKTYNSWYITMQNFSDRALNQRVESANDFKTSVADLKDKVTRYQHRSVLYRESLFDLSTMHCTDDVLGFKTTVETARSTMEDAADAARVIQDAMTDLHPKLTTLENEIKAKEAKK